MRVTTSVCGGPPVAVAVAEICEVPRGVGCAMVTKVDPGEVARDDVAVTVTVAGFGTVDGAV